MKKIKSLLFVLLGSAFIFSGIFIVKKLLQKPQEKPKPEVFDAFNMSTSRFNCVPKHVEAGQTMGIILNSYGISYTRTDSIDKLSKPFFDLKSIKTGNPYYLYYSNDSLNELQYFIYEINTQKYLQITFKDTLKVELVKREIETKIAHTTGIIRSSLWNTMKEINVSPDLALKLSEIFAWVIDFYRIQKNDRFKVFFEKDFIKGKEVGVGKVLAACFEHAGKVFYAFHFENDKINDYFNEKAESLRKAFLKAPLKFSRISSGFSGKRYHPVLKTNRPHLGTDYAAPTGTPIMSVGDGVVLEACYRGGNGNYVKIKHNAVYTTQYLHMSRIAKGIRPGISVKQGDIIGYVGSTGLATGPHVCFRFWKNGVQVNHLKEEFPNTAPLDSAFHKEFFKDVDWYMKGFERMKYEE